MKKISVVVAIVVVATASSFFAFNYGRRTMRAEIDGIFCRYLCRKAKAGVVVGL